MAKPRICYNFFLANKDEFTREAPIDVSSILVVSSISTSALPLVLAPAQVPILVPSASGRYIDKDLQRATKLTL